MNHVASRDHHQIPEWPGKHCGNNEVSSLFMTFYIQLLIQFSSVTLKGTKGDKNIYCFNLILLFTLDVPSAEFTILSY